MNSCIKDLHSLKYLDNYRRIALLEELEGKEDFQGLQAIQVFWHRPWVGGPG